MLPISFFLILFGLPVSALFLGFAVAWVIDGRNH